MRRFGESLSGRNAVVSDVLNATPDGILVVDIEGQVRCGNAVAERMFGYSPDSLAGRPLERLVPGALRSHTGSRRRPANDAPSPVMSHQRSLDAHRQDGSVFPVNVCLTSMGSGNVVCTIVAVRQVEGRQEATSWSRQQGMPIDEQVPGLEALGRLTCAVVHDFNHLLFIIKGNVDLLLSRSVSDHERRKMVADLGRAADRGTELTRELLAFVRRPNPCSRHVDVNAALTSMKSLLARIVGRDVRVTITAGADLHRVSLDERDFERVLFNLAANARDAMPSGGELTITTAGVEIAGLTRPPVPVPIRNGSYVQVTVRDNGCGMDPGTVTRAFEAFFTTKLGGQGAGLGLSTAQHIVERCNGHVWIESAVGAGTTVNILLPIAPPQRKRPRSSSHAFSVDHEAK